MGRVLRSPGGLIGSIGGLILVATAILAPILAENRATSFDTGNLLAGPGGGHWLGTDGLGRDIFARLLVATRESLLLALVSALIGAAAGTLIGALSTLLGRRLQRLFSSVLAIWLSFPDLLLVMFLSVIFGVGGTGAVVAVSIAFAPSFARLAQTLSSSVAARDYISAARVMGLSRRTVLFRHVLPNVAEPLILNTTFAIGGALLFLSGLSFLGLGVQPPAYDWGQMLSQGLDSIYLRPWGAVAPGAAIVIAGVVINFIGETLATLASGRSFGRSRRASWRRFTHTDPDGRTSAGPTDPDGLLRARGVQVVMETEDGPVTAVAEFGLSVAKGEIVGVVGESGSGKSMSMMALAGLTPPNATVRADAMTLAGTDPRAVGRTAARRLYARSLGMIFQDPMSSLNPLLRVGTQLDEAPRAHLGLTRKDARQASTQLLADVRIPDPTRRIDERPHQFSGGMRQRVMIAMSMACRPSVIIADEPTTALDVTVQREIMELLADLNEELGSAIVLISHDISLVVGMCERVLVMYAGRIVEELPTADVLAHARHPYTRALLASVPTMDTDRTLPLATIPGRPPQHNDSTVGCPFAQRCAYADETCRTQTPALESIGDSARLACWHPVEPAGQESVAARA